MSEAAPGPDRLERRAEAFTAAIGKLAEAPPFAKARYQTQVYRLASELMDTEAGLRVLLELAPQFAAAGTFHGGPWEQAAKLLPRLVGFSLRGEGVYPTVEALSELRMLAIARGAYAEEGLDAEDAEQFLREVCVDNLDLMFPDMGEEARLRPKISARNERLFTLIREHISITGFGQTLIEEVETVCAQRPIVTRRVQKLLDLAGQLPPDTLSPELRARLGFYRRATGGVTEASAAAGSPAAYADALARMDRDVLAAEAEQFAHSVRETGLSSPFHAVLVHHVVEAEPDLLADVLGLSPLGRASFEENRELMGQVIDTAIVPGTEEGIMGLAKALDRGLFSRPEIEAGVRRLLRVPIVPAAEKRLLALRRGPAGDELTARALLVAGAVGVLGLPLGIGQGNNPTCQSARGLSLWSQHAPGLLLKILVRAVRDGVVRCNFEQHDLVVGEQAHEDLGARLDLDLDPVSAVLVPLLDRLYAQLMALSGGRAADNHKWVNPAMYGSWVPLGFAAAFDPLTQAVSGHEQFLRTFYASHHPDLNGGYDLLYPNPVGIVITDVHANMLGYHAVSIQRVAAAPDGEVRVYFFNPNNEGRQRWGQGVAPTVTGHGERPGESSLPFGQFASRLYAYHYDPYEKTDEPDVPDEAVAESGRLARESWGRAVVWGDL